MTNWKTTLGGILAAIGQFLQTVEDPSWVRMVGQIIAAAGLFLLGASARDFNVTSEKSGATDHSQA